MLTHHLLDRGHLQHLLHLHHYSLAQKPKRWSSDPTVVNNKLLQHLPNVHHQCRKVNHWSYSCDDLTTLTSPPYASFPVLHEKNNQQHWFMPPLYVAFGRHSISSLPPWWTHWDLLLARRDGRHIRQCTSQWTPKSFHFLRSNVTWKIIPMWGWE
jgi:hypothetical protein